MQTQHLHDPVIYTCTLVKHPAIDFRLLYAERSYNAAAQKQSKLTFHLLRAQHEVIILIRPPKCP